MRNRYRRALCLLLGLGSLVPSARAQFKNGSQATELKLPTLSQRAITTQRIGLTDITINYCRPLVGGRTLFGKEIPYDKVWRTGADEATLLTTAQPIELGGYSLAPGTYSLFTVPYEDGAATAWPPRGSKLDRTRATGGRRSGSR